MTEQRVALIRQRIENELAPIEFEVIDESHLHRGHPGARDGRGHFRVRIVSDCFDGLPRITRHRQVYAAMGELMSTDIHALNIEAISPSEL